MKNIQFGHITTPMLLGKGMPDAEGYSPQTNVEHHHLLPAPRHTISSSELEYLAVVQHCRLKNALLQLKVDAAMTRLYCICIQDIQASSDLNYISEYV
jgi:hypothetical protein